MNKVVVITGASRGIGAATARLAGASGYAVCVNYREDRAAADRVAHEIERAGSRSLAVQADVADESDVVRLFETADTLGVLSGLVNNAGVLETQMRLEAMDVSRLQRVFATNVVGAFMCARESVRRMSTRHGGQGGAIVNVSSGAARLGSPGEYVDYAASKGAIDTMTIGLAREVAGEGIRVNAVRPAFIYTEMHASGGEPNPGRHRTTARRTWRDPWQPNALPLFGRTSSHCSPGRTRTPRSRPPCRTCRRGCEAPCPRALPIRPGNCWSTCGSLRPTSSTSARTRRPKRGPGRTITGHTHPRRPMTRHGMTAWPPL